MRAVQKTIKALTFGKCGAWTGRGFGDDFNFEIASVASTSASDAIVWEGLIGEVLSVTSRTAIERGYTSSPSMAFNKVRT